MTTLLHSQILAARDEIVSSPAARACKDRTFELPSVLYMATAALFLGFVGILSLAFRSPEMVLPFAVFVAFIAAFFVVPVLWTRIAPGLNQSTALEWSQFMEVGIATGTGRCSGREAATLVLLLPFLIFCFAIAIAAIAALV